MWLKFIIQIIHESIERFPKSSKLFLLHTYLQFGHMDNRYLAFFELSKAFNQTPDLQDSFSIYMYNYMIEDNIIDIDNVQKEGRKQIDVGKVIGFQDGLVAFIIIVDQTV